MDTLTEISTPRNSLKLKASILGSGFGIYGYLPAMCSLGWEVATLARYQQKIRERSELTSYSRDIQFLDSELELIDYGSAFIFTRTPALQFEFLNKNLQNFKNSTHVFLEKPLTNSLSNSMSLLDNLRTNQIQFSLGYLFPYTDWFMDLEGICAGTGNQITINWAIPISRSNWKNDESLGGGIVNSFLIHFVPVLARLGFSLSNIDIHSEDGCISLKSQSDNCIMVTAKNVTTNFLFEIWVNNQPTPMFQSQTPFGLKPEAGKPDPRISALKKYLSDSIKTSRNFDFSYQTELSVLSFLKMFITQKNIQ